MISALPGININNETTINRIPNMNSRITILTERETSFFSAPTIRKRMPINNIKKYQKPIKSPHSVQLPHYLSWKRNSSILAIK
jgi:hypothetical protein